MGRLFGTDGARGVANSELTCELAMQIGRAAAMVLTDDTHSRPPRIDRHGYAYFIRNVRSGSHGGLFALWAPTCCSWALSPRRRSPISSRNMATMRA